MDLLNKQEQLNKIFKDIMDASKKNISEKRKNFEHLTLLIGTILGFSVGLVTATNSEPSCFLVLSWLVDIIVIIIGCVYLIIEAESRYYRSFVVAEKQIDLVNKNEVEIKNIKRMLWKDMHKTFFDISSGEGLKEKIFIIFAKYQHRIEMFFYIVFVLSLLLLVISFI